MTDAVSDLSRAIPKGTSLDTPFRLLCGAAATLLLVALGGVLVSLAIGGWPAFHKFGFAFFTTSHWNPVTDVYGAAGPIVGTIVSAILALAMSLPVAFGVAVFLTEFCRRSCASPSASPSSCWPACRRSSTACGACSSSRRSSPRRCRSR